MAAAPSGDDLIVTLQKQLECPVCTNLCIKPIFMCCNGHNVCSSCQPQLDKCPVCRIPGRPSIRNLFAEELAQSAVVPCQNADKGCNENVKVNAMASHLEQCNFNFKCQFESCRWRGSVVDLADHARNVHSENFNVVTENGRVFKINDVNSNVPKQRTNCVAEPRGYDILTPFRSRHVFPELDPIQLLISRATQARQTPQARQAFHASQATQARQTSTGSDDGSRYSTAMLVFKNHIFWYHTKVVGKSSFNVQLHLIGSTVSTSCVPAFSYELEFLSGDGACLTYKNNVRPLKSEACSDKVFVEGLAWLDNGFACGMLYRIKLFEGAFRRDSMPIIDLLEEGLQSRDSKPENWIGD